MYYLTVDPGFGGTGYALWNSDQRWKQCIPPSVSDVISIHKPKDWVKRAEAIASTFDVIFKLYKVEKCWIELPGLHQTAVGMASASKGDIFKLTLLVGCFARVCFENGCEFIPLPVNEWKGQMPKEVIASRVYTKLRPGCPIYSNHSMDSVGMGLHLKGFLNVNETVRKKE